MSTETTTYLWIVQYVKTNSLFFLFGGETLLNKKALSPVVATIILIAVTVAVSIAVAAWMGALTFQFTETSPVFLEPRFLEPSSINVTITNQATSTIYPENLLINDVTVWPIVVISNLSAGSSKTSLIAYNWTYDTPYTFTFVWLNAANKEANQSVNYISPLQTKTITLPIPAFNNASYAIWEWTYYGQTSHPQFRSDMTLLPSNITIDATHMHLGGLMLNITVSYYESAGYPAFFQYIGEQEYIYIVT